MLLIERETKTNEETQTARFGADVVDRTRDKRRDKRRDLQTPRGCDEHARMNRDFSSSGDDATRLGSGVVKQIGGGQSRF